MKNTSKISLFLAILMFSFGIISSTIPKLVEAATPTIALAQSGTNMIQVSVYGDQNQAVHLYYYNAGSVFPNYVGTIGTTNSSGYFSTTLGSTSYNIPAGATVYVMVNGQQSTTTAWPSTSGGNVYLSQSSVVLNQGQSTTVGISGGSGNNYYVNSNSNSNVVGASISGNVLTLSGTNSGYATLVICSLSTNASCANISVTVNSSWGGNTGSIYLNPNSITVTPGQTQTAYINNYSGYYTGSQYNSQNYYISTNSGSQYFTASVSGNAVTIYGTNPGSGVVSICAQNNTSSCASLYVTVSNSYTNWNNSNWYNTYPYGGNTYGTGFTITNGNSNYSYPYSYAYPSVNTYTYPSTVYTYPTASYPTTYTNYSGGTYSSGSSVGSSVSGVFLSQVPSTGISFGLKMTLFTLGLLLWSMFAAFMIVRKSKDSKIVEFKLANMKRKGLI